jgi:hypothetical protein
MSWQTWRAAVALVGCVLASAGTTRGAVIGYWRMEGNLSLAPTPSPAFVPNEFQAGTSLDSTNGFLGTPAALGNFGLDSMDAAGANANVNGTAASYAALNAASITAEGFFRTEEGTAVLMRRTSGTEGFSIASPNDVTVTYFVNGVQQTVKGGTNIPTPVAIDLSATYTHLAFTYDATTGVANLYQNGILRGTNTTAGGGPMFTAASAQPFEVGNGMDGATLAGALVDEVRLSDVVLLPAQFVPEPSALGLLALPVLALMRRRRATQEWPR